MGVPGLWKEIQQHGIDCALARLHEVGCSSTSSQSSTTQEHCPQRPLRLGIDVSSWLFHARQSSGGYNPLLRLLFYRLCRLLAVPSVQPVFVFDGPLRPKEKRGSVRREYREPSFVRDFKDLIEAFGFVVHDAIGEAEAELASLNQRGILDAVMSDDVDSFIFGARIVVRNWGQELSGSKARSDYVAGNSASSEDTPASSGGEEYASTTKVGRTLSAKDRHALGANLLTYFRASEMNRDRLSLGGLILVAILSGGDYDVQGLPRCGVKISIALAKAGFGDSLLKGIKTHCKPSSQTATGRMAAPDTLKTWAPFLSEWLASVREELSTNSTGHLGRRFKKLADSDGFAELLSTKASLCVLASYVWPQTSQDDPTFTFKPIKLAKISKMCQHLFRWTAPATLDTLRNNLWEGCAVKELTGEGVLNLARSHESTKKASSKGRADEGVRISQFFAAQKGPIGASRSQILGTTGKSPLIQSIAGHRESGATGYVKEVRAICNVEAYVELAREGLDFDLTAEDLRGPLPDPPASQTSVTSSPRKRKPFADPSKELRLWISEAIVQESGAAQQALKAYQEKVKSKAKPAMQVRQKATGGQVRLENFFLGTKSGSSQGLASDAVSQKGHSTKVSPTKRRVPLQTSSQSSLSPPPSSPSPSPTPRPVQQRSPTKTASRVPPRRNPKKMREGGEEEEEGRGRGEVRLPEWNSELLDQPDEEEEGETDPNLSLDASLPDIVIPTQRNTRQQQKQAAISIDDSVEFIKVLQSPRKKKVTDHKGPVVAIEVSDDSDEDDQ